MEYWYDKVNKYIVCEHNCAEDWLELLLDVAVGYDGCSSIESFKSLVDELVEYSVNALKCIREGRVIDNKEESERSWIATREELMKDKEG